MSSSLAARHPAINAIKKLQNSESLTDGIDELKIALAKALLEYIDILSMIEQ
jgi:hypothetical protein